MNPQRSDPPPWDATDDTGDELDSLYRTAPVGLCLVDADLRYVRLNQRLADMQGAPIADHIGRRPSQVLPQVGELIEDTYRMALESGQPVDNLEISAAPDPDRLWLVNHRPLLSGDGTVRAVSSMFLDITRTRPAKPHSPSDEGTKALLESTHAVPWEADAKTWSFTYVGPQAVRLLGYPTDAWLEDGFWVAHLHPADREAAVITCLENSHLKENYEFEYRMNAADGREVWLHDIVNVEYSGSQPVKLRGFLIDVSERKRIEGELAGAREDLETRVRTELGAVTSELVLAEERERRRLAEDLHDGLSQVLSLAKMKLEGQLASGDAASAAPLSEVQQLLASAIGSLRSLTFQLSAPILYDLGFEAALEWLAEDLAEAYGLRIEFEDDGRPKPLDHRMSVLLYRSVRELLINVAKHSGTSTASLRLSCEEDGLHLAVEDEGIAFDPSLIEGAGLGLATLRKRLDHLGGSMLIDSTPGKGTRIELVTPLSGGN